MGCGLSCGALCARVQSALSNSVVASVSRKWCAALVDGCSQSEEQAVLGELNEWLVTMYADNTFLNKISPEHIQKKKRQIIQERAHRRLMESRLGHGYQTPTDKRGLSRRDT